MSKTQSTAAAFGAVEATSAATSVGSAFLATFTNNPQLAVAKLVTTMNRNSGIEPSVRQDLADTLDQFARDAATQPTTPAAQGLRTAQTRRSLAGGVVITRNKTSQVRNRDLSFAPAAGELASILAGEHLAHDLLATGMPDTLAGQADAIAHYANPIFDAYEVRKLERRGALVAEAAARHFINHGQPANLVFARTSHLSRWYAEQCYLADLEQRDPLATRLLTRPRLTWAHPDGVEHGLLIDRFHHTHQRGAIERDTWMRRKVAEDLTSIDAFLAPTYIQGATAAPGVANLGVRVHAHRAFNTGVHFLPDYAAGNGRPLVGGHHRLGGCQLCATRTVLPNSQTNDHSGDAQAQS